MILKDNDVGLISGNSAKAGHLLKRICHISPKTYNRLLDLQKELQKPEVAQWYQTELLFTPANFKTVKDNVDQAVSILSGRKDKGLFLDASLSAALGVEDSKQPGPEEKPDDGKIDISIVSAVGRWEMGAANLPADVQTVQSLLEVAAQKWDAPQIDPHGVDGKIAKPPAKSNTVMAIEAFQAKSNISVDGLLRPSSPAWNALLQAASGK